MKITNMNNSKDKPVPDDFLRPLSYVRRVLANNQYLGFLFDLVWFDTCLIAILGMIFMIIEDITTTLPYIYTTLGLALAAMCFASVKGTVLIQPKLDLYDIHFWSFSCASMELKKALRRDLLKIKYFTILLAFTQICTAMLFFFYKDDIFETTFFYMISVVLFPYLELFFFYFTILFLVLFSIIGVYPVLTLTYLNYRVIFQLYFIIDILNGIEKDVYKNETHKQSNIFKVLKKCAKQYGMLNRFVHNIILSFKLQIFVFYYSALTLGITTFYILLSGIYPVSPKFIGVLAAILIDFFVACYTGQELINQSINVSEALYNLPWYDWNEKNKKCLLILMINYNKPLKLVSYGNVQLSYETFLMMIKHSYTLLTFLSRQT